MSSEDQEKSDGSDGGEDPLDLPESELTEDENDTGETAAPAPARGGGLFAVVIAVLLFFALAAGAYYWHRNYYRPALAELEDRVAGAGTGQVGLLRQIEASEAGIEAANAATEAVLADVATLARKLEGTAKSQADLQRSVSALYEKETQTSVDWVLAEAEYLVLAATQRLALERDVDTAIAALRAADLRLRSADHPDLIPIRDQLIKDITALEGVNRADVEGLALYLAKTVDQVDDLPTKPIAEEVTPFSTVREGEYAAKDWRRLGYAIWSDLVDLVEVKDSDLPDSVLFDPELRYFLRQNLKLELASARLAVLRRDKANLEASATLIKRLLDAYYDGSDAGVKSIVARLDEAAALELRPPLPSITGSLDVIRKQRGNRAAAGAGR